MIVWSGLGFLVVAIVIFCFATVKILTQVITGDSHVFENQQWLQLATTFLSATVVWYVDRHLSEKALKESKRFIDVNTGEEHVVITQHSLFWIPMKYWPYIIVAIAFYLMFT